MKPTISLLFIFCAFYLQAQKKVDPKPEHIQLAKELKSVYEKDDIVILSSQERITFGIDKKNNLITVDHEKDEELMNIASRSDILKYEFYNSFSEIRELSVSFRNKRPTNFKVKDEFYQDQDIFYHDARVKYLQLDFPVQGYKYLYHNKKHYSDIKYFTQIILNNEFPILEKKVSITVPKWLDVEFKEFNFEGYEIRKEEKPADNIEGIIITYSIKNCKAMAKEKNMPGPSHIFPHILVLAKSAIINNQEKTLFKNTQDL